MNLRTAFSSDMKATENNGVISLKYRKKTTVYLEFCKLVKLSFKGEDGIRCFLKRKEKVFKHELNFTNWKILRIILWVKENADREIQICMKKCRTPVGQTCESMWIFTAKMSYGI